ncbi:hypothetical protein PHYSODRAFT_312145 [Phytophthora sojae]|uniref:Crinkler effector protein N-terminal domain-containing protein n=1 Tax=Phytophthora sojae (strain P6497) TaxID=1094619 RepID=G4Z0M8_PHYSP|nr:hypothetical protein PHYSODRAFT_312145 [Phytophthora sojae]EGZ25877.1 hypothetical protein PHYSODRAFT_312145 [Phytophthora sojae]|eukprot:XP_009521165.1 hypothetical protein PHYSODRAFT_312145 [Phytophthora sojae]
MHVAILKKAIKDNDPLAIQCSAADLQIFLAKTREGVWLTADDVMGDVRDTSGMKELNVGNATLRAYSLSEESTRVEVSDEDLVAGKGPVHVVVKIPSVQQPQSSLAQPRAAPKPRWKPVHETLVSLQNETLYFVDREQAVKQLCEVHKSTRLADNELGIGKSEFARQYIRCCREQWPKGVLALQAFKRSLRTCRTIVVEIDQAVFLELPDGAELPNYLCAPESVDARTFVHCLLRDLGPVFIVLDEIGRGFWSVGTDGTDTKVEEASRNLFLDFCSSVLSTWMSTRHVYFLLVGYAPFLRNVGERKDDRSHSSSKHKFIRLNLQLIRPKKIEQVIRHTWDVATAAAKMYKKTCGHPRTMIQMFILHESYEAFCKADVNRFDSEEGQKEWVKIFRELRYWQKTLEGLKPQLLENKVIDLSDDSKWPHIPKSPQKKISFAIIMERWIYALPRILTAIVSIVQPLRLYIRTIDPLIDDVTLAYATVFEWACLKRFQELFSEPSEPHTVLKNFFGTDTEFDKWGEIHFPSDHVDLPKITKATTTVGVATLDSATANPSDWPRLMDEIDQKLDAKEGSCLCLKPLPESSSADVIFVKRSVSSVGRKRVHDDIDARTLMVALVLKNYGSKLQFGPKQLEEVGKFRMMFDNLDSSTKQKFGVMTNVLIVCSTNYSKKYLKTCHKDDTSRFEVEALELDLSTLENRAEFFGLSSEPDLAAVWNGLVRKTELEKSVHES